MYLEYDAAIRQRGLNVIRLKLLFRVAKKIKAKSFA